jgi:hypothetical protein
MMTLTFYLTKHVFSRQDTGIVNTVREKYEEKGVVCSKTAKKAEVYGMKIEQLGEVGELYTNVLEVYER